MTTNPTSVSRDEQMVRITELRGDGACHSCGHPVTWTRTLAGALMPLEHELRVRALFANDLKQRITVRIAILTGTTQTHLVKNPAHEAKLVAQGCYVREELVEVWEIPASLTHWANCKTAAAHRSAKKART